MKFKYLSTLIAVAGLLITLVVFVGWKARNENFEEAKTNIIIRKIGHEILLLSGDSTSRVLPVKRLSENKYQIQFERPFTFIPDSLIKTISLITSANGLPSDYIVNVIECLNGEVIFGYAISGSEQNNIEPCIGRKQPEGCYFINLEFQNNGIYGLLRKYFVAGMSLVATSLLFFGIWLYFKRRNVANKKEENLDFSNDKWIKIGKYFFYNEEQCLVSGEEKIELTIKESKLLFIFASLPNQIFERSRLQKEVWEDDGVIVSRSLDMFISKLRKKLENDPAVKIVNIHGKGYKLEIGP